MKFLQSSGACVLLSLLMSACSSITTHSARGDATGQVETEVPCPQDIADQVKVAASASPWPDAFGKEGNELPGTNMLLGRRVLIAVAPGPGAAGLRLLSSRLTVTTIGGTFGGVDDSRAGSISNETSVGPRVRRVSATRAISVIPGRLQISPFVEHGTLRSQTVSVDVLVTPGGSPLDEMVVTPAPMWDAQRYPLSPDQAAISLQPRRHVTIYDQVEGTVSFSWVAVNRAHQEWACSAETRFILVDRASTTPNLWDLREASGARGGLWLALFNPKTGPFRVIFASPADADSFASWLRQTHAVHIAGYDVGLFKPGYSREQLRTLPEPHALADTFRTATADDLETLLVGRLGEP